MKAKRILIVEDDPDILEVLYYIFTEEGYEAVCSAYGGETAFANEVYPDLVLMDIRLGVDGIDGARLCSKLKAQHHTRDLPVILISAETDIRHIQRKCLADGYVSKPFDVEPLVRTVASFIGAN
jgi:two-component system response regulator VicR